MANIEISTLTRNNDGNTYIIKDANAIPKTGSNQISGDLVPATDNSIDVGSSTNNIKTLYSKNVIVSGTGNGLRMINSSEAMWIGNASGAAIDLCGKDYTYGNNQGKFILSAFDGNDYRQLTGAPDGTLTWDNKNVAMQEDVIPRSGGKVLTGDEFTRTANESYLAFRGGIGPYNGAGLMLFGKNYQYAPGCVIFTPLTSSTVQKEMRLKPDGTWTWDGTACQITSDQRFKQQINAIDDKLLDAWSDVTPVQFKYNDAVDQKGDNARLHTGYVVQQIDTACKSHNVDISEYGLYCHEEYPERTEEVEVQQEDGTTKKETKVIEEASEHYSLRYTETLVVECAYLRRENDKLKQQIQQILETLELHSKILNSIN